jgi:hypothetical protein
MKNKDWVGNSNSIYKTISASNHSSKERHQDDYYATDPFAIDCLLRFVELPDAVWECACGEGHLSERLKKYGHYVISTDLVDRGYNCEKLDFLEQTKRPIDDTICIVTNPPYKYAKEFVEKALSILRNGELCCMFLKLTFLEGKARKFLFNQSPPRQVLVFSERIICAKNGDFEAVKASGGSAVAYAWFVLEKGYKGRTVIGWV